MRDADDYKDYEGKYSVKEERNYDSDFRLSTHYPCHQVRVHKGWVKVRVVYTPDDTRGQLC